MAGVGTILLDPLAVGFRHAAKEGARERDRPLYEIFPQGPFPIVSFEARAIIVK